MLTRKQLAELRRADPEPNRIKAAMRIGKVRQVDLAAVMGISQSQISEDATGKYSTLDIDKARDYARFFGCTVDDLFPARDAVTS